MATLYTGRVNVAYAPFSERTNLDDLGAGLDYDNALMTDEEDNVIVFHTGAFGESNTLYTGRIIP